MGHRWIDGMTNWLNRVPFKYLLSRLCDGWIHGLYDEVTVIWVCIDELFSHQFRSVVLGEG